jgi:signal peptidase I
MGKYAQEEPWWIEAAKTIGLSLLLAFGIRSYVAEARYIPSGSMEPTLQINDRLIVEKVSYYFHSPNRGDIVVFNPTDRLRELGYKDAFIKRVVGVPGDQIAVREGGVFVNGSRLSEPYVNRSEPNSNVSDPTSVETCQAEGENAFLAQPQTIPPNHYLVLGDNRNNSYDGRCWGLVAKKNLVGRASFRFWPLQRVGTLPDLKAIFLK